MNNRRLKAIKGQEYVVKAICLHKTIKQFDPPEGKAGEVNKTPFQKELKIKVGAKVMLTYNVDTSDGLTNGARGELLGILQDSKGNIVHLVVKFEQESIGEEKRRLNPEIARRYPDGTTIEKVNFPFSISKSKTSIVNTANVIQFPIKLAFACTAHKVQGATISKPRKVILNVTDTFAAAMLYVMLSRVCSLQQIFILNTFDEKKMYPNQNALKELDRLEKISMNKNPKEWDKVKRNHLKISSLNCRSLLKHHPDIISDTDLMNSDLLCLQETWLEDDSITEDLEIKNYKLHLNSSGRGKGIATYFKESKFKHKYDIKEQHMQLSKFSSIDLDVVVIYKSQEASYENLNEAIEVMIEGEKPILVIGDFNFSYSDNSSNLTSKYMKEKLFKQMIMEPTHIEGNLLDHAHFRDFSGTLECTSLLQSKYYSDHRSLHLTFKKGGKVYVINFSYLILFISGTH